MKRLFDTVWQRQGISWIWDGEARNQVCKAEEIWSLRQFLMSAGHWPDSLPSNDDNALVVAGLDASLDLLKPDDAEAWLGDTIKGAILSFQAHFDSNAALVFWLPLCQKRIKISATDAVSWLCGPPCVDKTIGFGRVLWGEAREYPKEIFLGDINKNAGKTSAGLFHRRIS
jgi:hypothetical protein